jgi:hypothetical protein
LLAIWDRLQRQGITDPPPAVTLSSVTLLSRTRQPSTDSPLKMKGSQSTSRRLMSSRPSGKNDGKSS